MFEDTTANKSFQDIRGHGFWFLPLPCLLSALIAMSIDSYLLAFLITCLALALYCGEMFYLQSGRKDFRHYFSTSQPLKRYSFFAILLNGSIGYFAGAVGVEHESWFLSNISFWGCFLVVWLTIREYKKIVDQYIVPVATLNGELVVDSELHKDDG